MPRFSYTTNSRDKKRKADSIKLYCGNARFDIEPHPDGGITIRKEDNVQKGIKVIPAFSNVIHIE